MNDLKGIIEDCNKSDLVSDKVIKKVIEIIGQEEWQILHDENNDVCTTMGELIITLEGIAELKEFYENEYFQIADRTADEKIKELEKHQVEVTIDDYSPYDENTWGMMHEEWFVPKEEVRDLLKENYALITKAKEIIKQLLLLPYANNEEVFADVTSILDKAEQFLNSENEKVK